MMSRHVRWMGMVLIASATSCRAPGLKATDVERPTVLGDRCGIAERQSAPLIVDWTSGARDRLEARLATGVLAVKVSDCDITPLWQCTAPARYAWAPSTSRTESERIHDAKSLFAKLPTTAVSLEAKLNAETEIRVTKTTVGRFSSDRSDLAQADFAGTCDGATHFVSAVAVGAFRLAVGKRTGAAGGATIGGAGVGAAQATERELLSSDGRVEACEGTKEPTAPPTDCGAPIQVELSPLARSLTVEEFRAFMIRGTLAVQEKCSSPNVHSNDLDFAVVFEPGGTVVPRWYTRSTWPDGVYHCVHSTWEKFRVPPFSGPPLVGLGQVRAYTRQQCAPGDPGCLDHKSDIEKYFRHAKPVPLTRELADRIGYLGPVPEAPKK